MMNAVFMYEFLYAGNIILQTSIYAGSNRITESLDRIIFRTNLTIQT